MNAVTSIAKGLARGGAKGLVGGVVLCALGGAARAAEIEMRVTAGGEQLCGGIVTGVASCDVTGVSWNDEITVTWSLDASEMLAGYDLNVMWDPDELTLLSSSQLVPDSLPPDTNPFFPEGPDPGDPTGSKAVLLLIGVFETTDLFSMTFQLAGHPQDDGSADISWTPNGNGLSPSSVLLENPAGAGIDVIGIASVPALAPPARLLLAAVLALTGAIAAFNRRRT